MEILTRRRQRRDDTATIDPVASRGELLAMQAALEDVHVADVTMRYIVDLVRATRTDHRIALGASPRGALALLKLSRAVAALRHRDYVLPDDVKAMTVPALAHRLVLKPELWASRVSAAQVVDNLLTHVPAPSAGPA
jgi:MoxR-like ATPase